MIIYAPNQPGSMGETSGWCPGTQLCNAHEEKILVLAPQGGEAEMLCATFAEHGISCVNCSGVDELCQGVEDGAGTAVIAGEVLPQLLSSCLSRVITRQPPWSDFPLIVLTNGNVPFEENWKMLRVLERSANVTLLERPASVITLLSTVRTAIRSRRRQYELRELTGRRLAEQNLLKEKNFSDAAINSLPGIFYVMDAEGHNLRWNMAFQEVTGYSAREVVRMHPLEFVPNELKPHMQEKMHEVFLHGQASTEVDLLTKQGARIPYFLTAKRCVMEEEVYLIGMGIDVSQQKETARELSRLAAIVESSEDAIIGKDLEGVITSWNGAAERIFGYRSDEVVGRSIAILLPSDRVDEESKILERLRNGQRMDHFETVRIAKDGRKINVSLTISPIRDASGKVVGASKIARDITQKKLAEEALRRTRERLDLVAQSTEFGFWYCDLPFDKLVWDARTKEHFGLLPDAEVTIDTFYQRLHPDDRERTRQAIEYAIAKGIKYDIDYRTIGLDGRVRWIRAIGHAYYGDAGTPIRFDGITMDITDRKRVEKSLEAAKEEISRHATQLEKSVAERTATLEASLQSISGVLYHVAHDLRAPLRAMQGFTAILEEEYAAQLGETGGDYARRIGKAASRMDTLIQDLLAYGRLAHVPLAPATLDLNRQIKSVLRELAADIRATHASVRVDRLLPKVWADPAMLDLILLHLLKNALTFVAPGDSPRIEIQAQLVASGRVRIAVQDHGPGVALEHQERIFRVFERLHQQDVEAGTGIGLAIVRKAAERMGGVAGVESKPGVGSLFSFELPAARKNLNV